MSGSLCFFLYHFLFGDALQDLPFIIFDCRIFFFKVFLLSMYSVQIYVVVYVTIECEESRKLCSPMIGNHNWQTK